MSKVYRQTAADFEDKNGGYGYGATNKERGKFLEFCLGDTDSKEYKLRDKGSHIVTYQSSPPKPQANHCLVRNEQGKFVKDIKTLPSEELNTQQKH